MVLAVSLFSCKLRWALSAVILYVPYHTSVGSSYYSCLIAAHTDIIHSARSFRHIFLSSPARYLTYLCFSHSSLHFTHCLYPCMVLGLSCFLSCLSFFSRHSVCLCFMAFGIMSTVLFLFALVTLPSVSFAGLRSWVCGSCTICPLCPPCEPHLYVAPNCECRDNLNNCNCNCVTNNHLAEYQKQWTGQFMGTHNITFAAQMNSNQFKRQLLFWLIGLSFFNVFLLILVIMLIVLAPALLRRCAVWKSKSQLHEKQLIMKKHNLIEPPVSSSFRTHTGHPMPTLSLDIDANVSLPPLSYVELAEQLETQNRLVLQLTSDLHTAQQLRKTTVSCILPKIS